MFKKILIANRGDKAAGLAAKLQRSPRAGASTQLSRGADV